MGRRSRKPPPSQEAPKKRLSGEERDEIARASLKPLAPGERPAALIVAVAVAALYGIGTIVLAAAGVGILGSQPNLRGSVIFGGLMIVAAVGMWFQKYWATIGFQVFLALVLVLVATFIQRANSLLAAAVCVVIILFGGWLFWKLVRVLGRMRVPRPGDAGRAQ